MKKPVAITIANRKGGVGKTTSVWAIGHALAHRGHRVLFIDCDPQGNLSMALPATDGSRHLSLALRDGRPLPEAIVEVAPRVSLAPATPELTAVEKLLGTDLDYPFALRSALATLPPDSFDYVLFDTSPSPHSPLAVAALVASDAVFVPVHPAYFAYEGLTSLLDVVSRIRRNYNPALLVGGLFLTSYAHSYRGRLHKEFVDMLAAHPEMGPLLLPQTIRKNGVIEEAQLQRTSLYDYAPDSNACQDYDLLTNELLAVLARPTPLPTAR
jgi:chromosome partitioning protein